MKEEGSEFIEQLKRVRPVTRHLIESILLDAWPDATAVADFGIDSQEHYEAIYYPVRQHQIMPETLDRAVGTGKALTMMVRQAPSNPHRDIEFHTSWDVIRSDDPGVSLVEPEPEQDIEPEL
jgi:hypothetical protein